MKRKKILIAAILLGLLAWIGLQNSGTKWTPAGVTRERILEEVPEIVFTAEERAAMEALMDLPELERYSGSDDLQDLPAEMLEPFLEAFRGQDAAEFHGMYCGMPEELTVSFLFGEEKQIVLPLKGDGTYLKVIALYEGRQNGRFASTACYENQNGALQKLVPRKWFF